MRLTDRMVTLFADLSFLVGGRESSFSVLLCLILLDEAGFGGIGNRPLRIKTCTVR